MVEHFLAVTSKVSGSSWSITGLTVWVSFKTPMDCAVREWKILFDDWKSTDDTYLLTAISKQIKSAENRFYNLRAFDSPLLRLN